MKTFKFTGEAPLYVGEFDAANIEGLNAALEIDQQFAIALNTAVTDGLSLLVYDEGTWEVHEVIASGELPETEHELSFYMSGTTSVNIMMVIGPIDGVNAQQVIHNITYKPTTPQYVECISAAVTAEGRCMFKWTHADGSSFGAENSINELFSMREYDPALFSTLTKLLQIVKFDPHLSNRINEGAGSDIVSMLESQLEMRRLPVSPESQFRRWTLTQIIRSGRSVAESDIGG